MNPAEQNYLSFTFRSIEEARAGDKWRREFDSRWPAYKDWFIRSDEAKRPTYLDSVSALRRYMPEFLPVYEDMVELAGGGDRAARFLAQYCPPPLFPGCSQAVYIKDEPVMVRNYDYSPYLCDGLVMHTRFDRRRALDIRQRLLSVSGRRPVCSKCGEALPDHLWTNWRIAQIQPRHAECTYSHRSQHPAGSAQ